MSIEAVRVTVDCDRCEERADVEIVRLDDAALDRALRELGWWQRSDLSDVCPNHPSSSSSSPDLSGSV